MCMQEYYQTTKHNTQNTKHYQVLLEQQPKGELPISKSLFYFFTTLFFNCTAQIKIKQW
jgi:hypothetical protein